VKISADVRGPAFELPPAIKTELLNGSAIATCACRPSPSELSRTTNVPLLASNNSADVWSYGPFRPPAISTLPSTSAVAENSSRGVDMSGAAAIVSVAGS